MELLGKHFEPTWKFIEKKRLPSTKADFFELWTSFAEIPKDPEAVEFFNEIISSVRENREFANDKSWTNSDDLLLAFLKCSSQSIVKSLPLTPATRNGLSDFIEAMDQINGLYDIRRTVKSEMSNPQKAFFGGAQFFKIPDRIKKLSQIYQKSDWYQSVFIEGGSYPLPILSYLLTTEGRAKEMGSIVDGTVVKGCDPVRAMTSKEAFLNEAVNYLRELREETAYWENAYLRLLYSQLGYGWSPNRAPNIDELSRAQERVHAFHNREILNLISGYINWLNQRQCRLATVMSNFRIQWEEKWEPLVEKKMAERKEAYENFKKYTVEYRDAIWDCKSKSEIEAAYEKMEAVAKSPCGHGFDDPADMQTWGELFGDFKKFIGLPSIEYTPDRTATWKDILDAPWTDEEVAVWDRLREIPSKCSEEALAEAKKDLETFIGFTETANLRCNALRALEEEKFEEKVEKFEEDIETVLAFLRDDPPPNAVAVMKEICDPGLALEVFQAYREKFRELPVPQLCTEDGSYFAEKVEEILAQKFETIREMRDILIKYNEKDLKEIKDNVEQAQEKYQEAELFRAQERKSCEALLESLSKANHALGYESQLSWCKDRSIPGAEEWLKQARKIRQEIWQLADSGSIDCREVIQEKECGPVREKLKDLIIQISQKDTESKDLETSVVQNAKKLSATLKSCQAKAEEADREALKVAENQQKIKSRALDVCLLAEEYTKSDSRGERERILKDMRRVRDESGVMAREAKGAFRRAQRAESDSKSLYEQGKMLPDTMNRLWKKFFSLDEECKSLQKELVEIKMMAFEPTQKRGTSDGLAVACDDDVTKNLLGRAEKDFSNLMKGMDKTSRTLTNKILPGERKAKEEHKKLKGYVESAAFSVEVAEVTIRKMDKFLSDVRNCTTMATTVSGDPEGKGAGWSEAIFIVRIEGSGFTPTYGGGTWKVSGSEERYLVMKKHEFVSEGDETREGTDPNAPVEVVGSDERVSEKMEEIEKRYGALVIGKLKEKMKGMKDAIDGVPCERTFPTQGVIEEDPGGPHFLTSGAKVTIVEGPYFSWESLEGRELKKDWRLNGKDGPHPIELGEMAGCR
ncbi:hypothetical protein ACFL4N_04540 [Thermodesulfobacteriota bacterium]